MCSCKPLKSLPHSYERICLKFIFKSHEYKCYYAHEALNYLEQTIIKRCLIQQRLAEFYRQQDNDIQGKENCSNIQTSADTGDEKLLHETTALYVSGHMSCLLLVRKCWINIDRNRTGLLPSAGARFNNQSNEAKSFPVLFP